MRVTCVLFISGILLTGADAVRSVKQLQPAIERNDYGKGSKTEVLDVKVGDTKKRYLVSSIEEHTKIVFAKHQNDAGMLGAFYHFCSLH